MREETVIRFRGTPGPWLGGEYVVRLARDASGGAECEAGLTRDEVRDPPHVTG